MYAAEMIEDPLEFVLPAQLAGAAVNTLEPGNIIPAKHKIHLDDAILEFGFDEISRLRVLHIAVPDHVAETLARRIVITVAAALDPAGRFYEIPGPRNVRRRRRRPWPRRWWSRRQVSSGLRRSGPGGCAAGAARGAAPGPAGRARP